MVSLAYDIQDTRDGFHVVVGNPVIEQCEVELSKKDMVRVLGGSLILRGGLMIRRVEEEIEFRIVRPGVRSDRRELGKVPTSAFLG